MPTHVTVKVKFPAIAGQIDRVFVWVIRRTRGTKKHGRIIRFATDTTTDAQGFYEVTFPLPDSGEVNGKRVLIKAAGVDNNKRVKAVTTVVYAP